MSSKENVAINQLFERLECRYALRVLWALKDGHPQTFRFCGPWQRRLHRHPLGRRSAQAPVGRAGLRHPLGRRPRQEGLSPTVFLPPALHGAFAKIAV